jgi:hypothetical protein
MKEEEKKLIDAKEQILTSIDILFDLLEEAEEMGFHDYDEALHNELVDLEEDTEGIDIYLELESAINRAKGVEKQIETFLAKEGISSADLEWPTIL